jgi:hypothetical protein
MNDNKNKNVIKIIFYGSVRLNVKKHANLLITS